MHTILVHGLDAFDIYLTIHDLRGKERPSTNLVEQVWQSLT